MALASTRYGWLVAAVGASGVAILARALRTGRHALALALTLLVAGVVLADLLANLPRAALIVCPAGYLASSELATIAISLRDIPLINRPVMQHAALAAALAALGGASVTALVLEVPSLTPSGWLTSTIAGAVAAVAAIALIVGVARSTRPEQTAATGSPPTKQPGT